MSSKLILITIFILTSCGVKKYPKTPANNRLPEITDSYKYQADLEENKKKKDKAIKNDQKSQN